MRTTTHPQEPPRVTTRRPSPRSELSKAAPNASDLPTAQRTRKMSMSMHHAGRPHIATLHTGNHRPRCKACPRPVRPTQGRVAPYSDGAHLNAAKCRNDTFDMVTAMVENPLSVTRPPLYPTAMYCKQNGTGRDDTMTIYQYYHACLSLTTSPSVKKGAGTCRTQDAYAPQCQRRVVTGAAPPPQTLTWSRPERCLVSSTRPHPACTTLGLWWPR